MEREDEGGVGEGGGVGGGGGRGGGRERGEGGRKMNSACAPGMK